MAFEGLLGGGDPLDLYGDLFTDKQRQALQQRELSRGLLSFAEKLGAASAPSRAPKGSFLGLLGQSLGGGFAGGDEAANKQLEAMALAEKVRASKQQRGFANTVAGIAQQLLAQEKSLGLPPGTLTKPYLAANGGAAAPAAPGAPGGDYGAAGEYGVGQALPPAPPAPVGAPPGTLPQVPSLPSPADPRFQGGAIPPQTSLLPPPPGANPQMGAPPGIMSASLYNGGVAPGTPPFSGGGLPPGAAGPEDAGAGGDGGGPDVVIPSGPRLQRSDLTNVAAPGGGGYGASREGTVAYWRSRGAPEHVAQGIADRVNAESGFRPSVMGDKGTSGGLYQHHADRLARLQRFAAAQGKPWTDPDVQHQFAGSETQGGDAIATRGMPAIMAAPDRQTAATLWDKYFERSKYGPGSGGGTQMASGGGRPDLSNMAGDAGGGGDAGEGRGGNIPGLNISPQGLAALNMLSKLGGLGEPFGSLLETYYKSPGYLAEKARTEAQATKDVALEYDPKIEAAKAAATQRYIQENEAHKSKLDIAKELLTRGGVVQNPDGSYRQIREITDALAAVDNAKQTGDQKEYTQTYVPQELAAGRIPKPFEQWDINRRRAPSSAETPEVAEYKARIAIDQKVATEASEKALAARQLMPLLDEALAIARKTPESMAGAASVRMAQIGSLFGIAPTPGQSNAELLASINQRLIPMVREPGATAALEMDRYLAAGPGLMSTADGRVKIAEMTKALGQRAIEIAKVYRANIGKPELYEKLAEFDRPLFTDEQRAAMDAAMSGAVPPAEGAPPKISNDAAGKAIYDSLQPGTPFIDPTGKPRVK